MDMFVCAFSGDKCAIGNLRLTFAVHRLWDFVECAQRNKMGYIFLRGE